MTQGICSLCKQNRELRRSHIIPRFVSKWLKNTSATGFLRGVKEPDKRMQDIPTSPLLCGDCEQLFSKLESYFASYVFYPLLNDGVKEITYDVRLLRFTISLSWRTLKISYDNQIKHTPWIRKYLDKAEETWRNFLLMKSTDSGLYEHHLLFLDYVEKAQGMPNIFQWYTLRATDATLVSNPNVVFTHTHFPWMFFVSTIFPLHFSGWKGTRIENKGKINRKFEINDNLFGNFLINRSKTLLAQIKGIKDNDRPIDRSKILKSLEKDPNRFLKSESFNVMIEESKRERQERIKKLPKTIQGLIDIINRSLEHPELDLLQQKWIVFTQHMNAEILSHLPLKKAKEIDSSIEATILKSRLKKSDTKCILKLQK